MELTFERLPETLEKRGVDADGFPAVILGGYKVLDYFWNPYLQSV